MRNGQISFDYIAGALVFFAAVILLAGNVIDTLPQLQNARAVDELELTGWAFTTSIMHSEGYWDDGIDAGTDWETSDHIDHLERIGLRQAGRISPAKVNALLSLNGSTVSEVIGTEKNVNIELTRTIPIDTTASFTQGSPPSYLTEPTYPPGITPTLHYGSGTVNGNEAYFLLANESDWYNYLWVSTSWEFDGSSEPVTEYNLSETRFLTIGGIAYQVPGGTTAISDGRLLVLERRLGRVGPLPRIDSENIARIKRYGAIEGDILEVVFRIWS